MVEELPGSDANQEPTNTYNAGEDQFPEQVQPEFASDNEDASSPIALALTSLDEAELHLRKVKEESGVDGADYEAAVQALDEARAALRRLITHRATGDVSEQRILEGQVTQDKTEDARVERIQRGSAVIARLKAKEQFVKVADLSALPIDDTHVTFSSGHLDELLGVLDELQEAEGLASSSFYVVESLPEENNNVMVIGVRQIEQLLHSHSDNRDLINAVFFHLGQEVMHHDTKKLKMLVNITAQDLKDLGGENAHPEEITAANAELENYRSKIKIALHLSKAVSSLLRTTHEMGIDLGASIPSIMYDGQNMPFEDALKLQIEKNLQ